MSLRFPIYEKGDLLKNKANLYVNHINIIMENLVEGIISKSKNEVNYLNKKGF